MTSFSLISLENDYKVDISEGKVTVGRGPFLKITDKRVSRNHATLEVSAGSLTIIPTHTNPTFYQASGESKFQPLEKDEVKKLEKGDCISFLPKDLIFRVGERDTGNIEDTTAEQEVKKEDSNVSEEDVVEDNEKILDRKDNVEISKRSEGLVPEDLPRRFDEPEIDDEEDNEYSDEDDTKFEETAQVLNKTRVLPDWMTKTKGGTTKKNVAKVAAETEVKVSEDLGESPGKPEAGLEEKEEKTLEEKKDEKNEKNVDDDESDTTDDHEDVIEKHVSPVTKEEDKKRKRDENEDEGQSSKREKKLPSCPYGSRCYRKNPDHFQEYSHEQESDKSENEGDDDLPECPYGEYCYRKNPRHRREYKHTPQPKTRERKAKRKAATGKIRDDDEDGANDYDLEDSFIDDESESEHEASDDSDWQPSGGEDDDDDDVGELLSEARNFTQNKKMMKPT